ncbi:MAG: hypothetical protein DRQ55_13320 [Planctomycetota bacterium]|nr:MAG: hypothetical protein DRQ55_13320 [Planctomycetota bacterium]
MTDDRWKRIKDLFGEACELPTQLRRGFLGDACAGDDELQSEVEALLEHHTGAELADDDPEPQREGEGSVIDRYRLLEPIGEGGMGEVWMAEQLRPVKRKVALKIIKLGMDTAEVVARFEAERQALALMDHPHIAKVLDGGATEAGRPFFVMELVKGIPITEWCDEAGLDTPGRLELFRHVCRAVQHAHTRGIIHRDIKPSNVLVTLHDGLPVPKVIDFGIAKAVDQELTERTCFTRYRQVVGTPESMAPEQAEMSGLDVDARADIYSLGVLLYELLTGAKPFDPEALRDAGYLEMLRTIREVDPPKPSTRLTALGERLKAVAERRGAPAGALSRQLSGDLDWIVMKCLEKDRTRRYETANDLAADVGRHLDCEPVEASPPSFVYRFGKLARRRRGAVAAAALLVLGLCVGFVAASVQYQRMRSEWQASLHDREVALAQSEAAIAARQTADANYRASEQQRVRSDRANAFFAGVLGGAEPAVGRQPGGVHFAPRPTGQLTLGALGGVAVLLEDAARQVEFEFEDDPEMRTHLRTIIGRGFTRRGLWQEAEEFIPQAYAVSAQELGEDAPWVIEMQNEMTDVLFHSGQHEDAAANQERVVELMVRLKGDRHPDTLAAVSGLASVYLRSGHTAEAERVLSDVLSLEAPAPSLPAGLETPRSARGPRVARAPRVSDSVSASMSVSAPSGAQLRSAAEARSGTRHALSIHAEGGVSITEDEFVFADATPGKVRLFVTDGAERVTLRAWGHDPHDTERVLERTLLGERLKAAMRPGSLATEKNAAAWALLTTPSEELHDADAALVLSRAACEATGHADPAYLDTLSLALFRSGFRDEAIKNQRAALELVAPTRTLLIADMRRALAVFEGHLPEPEGHERVCEDGG